LSLHEALRIGGASKSDKFRGASYTRFKAPCVRVAPSVLAFVGFRVGKISKISSVITSSQASFTASKIEDFKPKFGRTLAYYHKQGLHAIRKAWPPVYEHWREITEPLLIHSNSASSSVAKMNIRGNSKYVPFSKNMFDKESEHNDVSDIAEMNTKYIKKLAAHLLIHSVEGFNYEYDYFISGRKFATLDDGTLCLVPGSAEAGDSACFFFGHDKMPFVIRLIKLEQEQADLLSDTSILEEFPDYGKVRVGHYELVGQCFLDKWMRREQFDGRYISYTTADAEVRRRALNPREKNRLKKWIKWGEEQDSDLWLDAEIFALH
jgi:hypothetical protein